MSHIVESCPLTNLNGGLSRLHSANEDAVLWLTNYGQWHAYEKKKTKSHEYRLYFYLAAMRAGWVLFSVVTSAEAKVMWPCFLSVCVSFCEQDYWKRSEPISLKLGVMMGPTNRKNWLTFGGVPVPDADSGSLFHFPHCCGIWDFRRFIGISDTVTVRFLRNLANDYGDN